MRNPLISLSGVNLKRLLPLLAFIFVTLSVLARLVYAKENADENGALPDACGNFSLVSGNLNAGRVFVLGENHMFQMLTFSCLYALAGMLKLENNFKFYYEGPTVNPGAGSANFERICKKAVACQSWDNKKAFISFGRLPVIAAQADYLAHLSSQKLTDNKMYQLLIKELHAHTQNAQVKDAVFVRSLWNNAVAELTKALIQGYRLMSTVMQNKNRQAVAEKTRIFELLFRQLFERILSQAPKRCKSVSKNRLADCIVKESFSAPSHHKRDKSLQKHIRAQLKDSKTVGFFIAGRKHVEPVPPQDGLVVLQFVKY